MMDDELYQGEEYHLDEDVDEKYMGFEGLSLEEYEDGHYDELEEAEDGDSRHRKLMCGGDICVIFNPLYNPGGFIPVFFPVDWCYDWGKNCGYMAAQKLCEIRGFDVAYRWKRKDNVGNTWVLGAQKECPHDWCDGFEFISCGPYL